MQQHSVKVWSFVSLKYMSEIGSINYVSNARIKILKTMRQYSHCIFLNCFPYFTDIWTIGVPKWKQYECKDWLRRNFWSKLRNYLSLPFKFSCFPNIYCRIMRSMAVFRSRWTDSGHFSILSLLQLPRESIAFYQV